MTRARLATCWYAVWVHSHCERLVRDQLTAKGFEMFLPEVSVWTMHDAERRVSSVPLFPGYLFVHHAMDKESHARLLDTRGLVRVLGERWVRLAAVPDREVDSVRRLVESRLSPAPHPYLKEGRRVRIHKGPLAGVEGILVALKADTCVLVVSIELFQRSVAVEVDCARAVAA